MYFGLIPIIGMATIKRRVSSGCIQPTLKQSPFPYLLAIRNMLNQLKNFLNNQAGYSIDRSQFPSKVYRSFLDDDRNDQFKQLLANASPFLGVLVQKYKEIPESNKVQKTKSIEAIHELTKVYDQAYQKYVDIVYRSPKSAEKDGLTKLYLGDGDVLVFDRIKNTEFDKADVSGRGGFGNVRNARLIKKDGTEKQVVVKKSRQKKQGTEMHGIDFSELLDVFESPDKTLDQQKEEAESVLFNRLRIYNNDFFALKQAQGDHVVSLEKQKFYLYVNDHGIRFAYIMEPLNSLPIVEEDNALSTTIPESDLLPYAEAILSVLQRGVVSNDLHYFNIMLDKEGKLKVTDFGLSSEIDRTLMGGKFPPPEAYGFDQPEGQGSSSKTVSNKDLKQGDKWSLGLLFFQLCFPKKMTNCSYYQKVMKGNWNQLKREDYQQLETLVKQSQEEVKTRDPKNPTKILTETLITPTLTNPPSKRPEIKQIQTTLRTKE